MYSDKEVTGDELAVVGEFEVQLDSRGNPDFRQDPGNPLPGVPSKRVPASSLVEAAKLCRAYIDEHELGGGNWTGGDVFVDDDLVARVSYNGRVWRAKSEPSKKLGR